MQHRVREEEPHDEEKQADAHGHRHHEPHGLSDVPEVLVTVELGHEGSGPAVESKYKKIMDEEDLGGDAYGRQLCLAQKSHH